MNRSEHLQWAKDRALEYVEVEDLTNAFNSMCSDLGKHDELRNHAGLEIGAMLQFTGQLNNKQEMERWIKGFN